MPKKPRPAAPKAIPTALDRAEHGGPPIVLRPDERELLNEALRRGEDLRESVESSVTSFGRWLLDEIFHNDTAAALDFKTRNRVWTELVRRAGGPTLRISRRLLYVALTIAANDKRILDQGWRGLDAARKELLLPLRTSDGIREAAQHVAKFNLTQAKTREYVTSLLETKTRPRQVRVTVGGLTSNVKKLREKLAGAAVLRKVAELGKGLSAADRRRTVDELDRLKGILEELSRALRT